MRSEEHPFTPEDVDEQIDRSSQASPALLPSVPAAPEARMIQELRTLYSAETREMTDAIARGRERLAESQDAWSTPQQEDQHASDYLRALPERSAKKPALQRVWGARRWPARLASLAAAVLLLTLVSSLVAGLILVRHNTTGGTGNGRAATQTGATATSAPAQMNLYLVSQMDGSITKVDPATKTVLWTYQWLDPSIKQGGSYSMGFGGPMLAGDGSLYFSAGAAAGHNSISLSLYALDAQTGTRRWSQQQPASPYPTLLGQGVIYVNGADGLYALNASDGSVRWHALVSVDLDSLVLANGILYGTTFQTTATNQWSSSLFAVNASSGALLWQSALPANKSFTISATVNGTLCLTSVEQKYKTNGALAVTSDGKPKISYVYAYSLDGKQHWQSQAFDGYLSGLTVAGGVIYTIGNDAYALSAKDGSILWQYQPDTGALTESTPIVANGTLYLESGPLSSGTTIPNVLIALDSQTGTVQWKQQIATPHYEGAGPPVLANGVLYVVAGGYPESSLDAFSADNGAPLWQMSLAGDFNSLITAAP